MAATGTPDDSHHFLGKPLIRDFGLVATDARMYDPRATVFLSPDPVLVGPVLADIAREGDPWLLPVYRYARGNPVMVSDNSGRVGLTMLFTHWNWGEPQPVNEPEFFKDLGVNMAVGTALWAGGVAMLAPESAMVGAAYLSSTATSAAESATVALATGNRAQVALEVTGEVVAAAAGVDYVASGPVSAVTAASNAGAEVAAGAITAAGNVVDDLPMMSGMLRDAAIGKGNFGIGSATRAQADAMGRAWVGEGYKVASDGKTLVSADGMRQYRPPSYKPNLKKHRPTSRDASMARPRSSGKETHTSISRIDRYASYN